MSDIHDEAISPQQLANRRQDARRGSSIGIRLSGADLAALLAVAEREGKSPGRWVAALVRDELEALAQLSGQRARFLGNLRVSDLLSVPQEQAVAAVAARYGQSSAEWLRSLIFWALGSDSDSAGDRLPDHWPWEDEAGISGATSRLAFPDPAAPDELED